MHIRTNAPEGSYESLAVGVDTGVPMSGLMSGVLQPIGAKLDKDMAELRAEIAALKGGSATASRKSRRQRKTRKSRK